MVIAVVVAAALIGAPGIAGSTTTTQETERLSVHVATSGPGSERLKTLPIAKRARAEQRVVYSLGPRKLRRLRSGDWVEGKAELQVSTTCVGPNSACVGRKYRFSPTVAARLVLARGPKAVRERNVVPVSDWERIRCSHSNHHCVMALLEAEQEIADVSELPCDNPRRCHLNLVASAHHPNAERDQKLVVGTDHRVRQNKGQLAVAVYRPPEVKQRGTQLVTTKRLRESIPIGPNRRGEARRRVIYSQQVDRLRAGEQLVVDARAVGRIGHRRYNALVQSKLILSRHPLVAKRAGVPKAVGSFQGRFGAQNGFNCTQRRSAHPDPCVIRKGGVMRIIRDARVRPRADWGRRIPLYVSLVVGTRAVGAHGHRRRKGDRMRITDDGFLRVHRYGRWFNRSVSPDPSPTTPSPLPPLLP
jgi:hypothetical protein